MMSGDIDFDPTCVSTLATQSDLQQRSAALIPRLHSLEALEDNQGALLQAIMALCDASHLILYAVDRSKRELYVKCSSTPCTGPWAQSIPINRDHPWGYCALRGKPLNIADVTDPDAWAAISPHLHFDPAWDAGGLWHTRQALALPILVEHKYLMGILLLINKHSDMAFTDAEALAMGDIAAALGQAMQQQYRLASLPAQEPSHERQDSTTSQSSRALRGPTLETPEPLAAERTAQRPSKFDYLLEQQLLTRQELSSAISEARRKGCDVETVLLETYH
ncbi:MAG: GAF domain-containing protein, partial [Candidatus Tectimicrobiota bacterium]